ncbi:glutamine synthetase family protein [Nitratireductor sp. L1-7-SE]|uniref:Glutamine synthetase family protein n=1 Tax=Nitratireductor rhodophyticola TaxID=2854036 RepID=A0ABS7R7H6_9HYPH|nr:glutamine synthetase family protein [Nitratireductor rhodophyticola]MBY8916891.1 glutamine synthetase family protein [Nitratireductor rhodophyticola]MBY8920680.1 glutamine synthetase family protein [Nitratireductor rhodophyticola]
MNRPETNIDTDVKPSPAVSPEVGEEISTEADPACGDFISADHEAEYRAFVEQHPDLEAVEFLIVDPNGIIRGKWAPGDSLKKAFQEGVNFPMSLHGLDVWGREVDETGLHIETGDKDGYCRATRGSLSIVPWARRKTAQVLLQTFTPEGEPFMADSRQVLKHKVVEANAKGFFPVAAFELEFYLLDPEKQDPAGMPTPLGAGEGPDRLRMYGLDDLAENAALFDMIRDAAAAQNLPIDTIIKEAAPGQFEVNLKHRADPLRAADDVILLRRIVMGCARAHGLTATFMAKPFIDYAGNGMHVHTSMLGADGQNIFAGETGRERLLSAVAGLIDTMPESLILYINTWNGFRRITPGSYAPTHAVWAENNRSVALRIPVSTEENRRVEHRISGADANPYLVMAAIIQGMIEGIEAGAKPPPPVEGSAYDETADLGRELPDDMDDALQLALKSRFIDRALGPLLAKVYRDLKRAEIIAFWSEITPLERTTYL